MRESGYRVMTIEKGPGNISGVNIQVDLPGDGRRNDIRYSRPVVPPADDRVQLQLRVGIAITRR
jgi:hypothetical protein